MLYFLLEDLGLLACCHSVLDQLLLLGLLLVDLLEEVRLVREEQGVLEGLRHLLDAVRLLEDLDVHLLFQLSSLELGEVVELHQARVEVLQRCHSSRQICLKLLDSRRFLLILLPLNCQPRLEQIKAHLAQGAALLLEILRFVLQVHNLGSLGFDSLFQLQDRLVEHILLFGLLGDLSIESLDVLLEVSHLGHQVADLVLQQLGHLLVQLLLVLDLPLQVLNLYFVLLLRRRGQGADLRLLVVFG